MWRYNYDVKVHNVNITQRHNDVNPDSILTQSKNAAMIT